MLTTVPEAGATMSVPEAAAMLDMEPFNPETGQGFGCFGCHPTE